MPMPNLPSRPTRDCNVITAAWVGRLLDCVDYAMRFPQGDGKTILRSGDVLSAIQRTRPAGGGAPAPAVESYLGSFAVSDVSGASGDPPVYACKVRVRPGNVCFPAIDIWSYPGAEIEFSEAGGHYIYSKVSFTSDLTGIACEICNNFEECFPVQDSFVDIVPLATVAVKSSGDPAKLSISDITQHHYGDYGADTRLW